MLKRGLVAVACLALALPAHAFVISEDPLEESSFVAGGAVRSYNLLLHGGPLSAPFVPRDENPAAVSIVALRPKLELKHPEFAVVIHDELTSSSSTLPASLLGSTLSIGKGAATPTWLPLAWSAVDHSRFQLQNRIDWLYARASFDDMSLTLGRQPITIGRGHIWTPEDLLVPFSPLQLNTEYKPGVDAVRLDLPVTDGATLMLVGALGKREPKSDFEVGKDGSAVLARVEASVAKLRLGALGGYVRGDAVGGIDLFVDLGGGTDLHGSTTVTYVPDTERRRYGRAAFERAVLGSTSQLHEKLLFTAEAYVNGSGAPKPKYYLDEMTSPRFAVGEAYNVGRLYVGVAADWELHPLLHALGSAILNAEDPSAILAPELDFDVAENTLLVAGAFIPVGKGPRYEATAITPESEFGLYPRIYHLDAKIYF
ncbi:MAG: hypothetical protein R3B13_16165 [Polyangiaceae bacterium]